MLQTCTPQISDRAPQPFVIERLAPQDTPTYTPPDRRALFTRLSRRGQTLIARLTSPSIGHREATIVSATISRAIDREDHHISTLVIDCGHSTFRNSAGLGMCLDLRNRMAERHGKTVLYRASSDLLAIMRLMRIDRLFTIAHTEHDLRRLLD